MSALYMSRIHIGLDTLDVIAASGCIPVLVTLLQDTKDERVAKAVKLLDSLSYGISACSAALIASGCLNFMTSMMLQPQEARAGGIECTLGSLLCSRECDC